MRQKYFVHLCLAVLTYLVPFNSLRAEDTKPIRALLVIGGCCHDYRQQKKLLTEGISARANVEWTVVHEGDGTTTHKMGIYSDPDWSKGYDVVVHDECSADVKDKAFVEGILKPHRSGLPAVNLHCAMHSYRVSFDEYKEWFAFTGLDTRSHGAQLPIAINFVDSKHPITTGLQNWTTVPEELYNNVQIWNTVTPLAYGQQGNDKALVAWVNDYHGTRVFSTTLGHNNETVNDPRYLDFITRGLLWSVNKLNPDYLKPAKRVLAPLKAGKMVMVPENLALDKPVTASASQAGNDPAHAVDGNADTRWCAPDNGAGYWLQVDLKKVNDIAGCQIVWEKGDQAYQYKIESSRNGTNWKTLVEVKGTEARPEIDKHKFEESGVRYVRITVTKAPDGAWASFWEFEVFGKNMVEKMASQVNDPRLSGVSVPPGYEAVYFAGPPDISYPTCIAATPSGEVFVGVDQNGSLGAQPNRGWITRCLDTDGDGVADKFNVFARMDSPRGIVVDRNTLYVMHPPVLEAYHDDNGDGVADRSEVLVKGLAHDLQFRGADHTCNGVRMGIDGWLYIALGDYGATNAVAKDGSQVQLYGGGIIRVRPDGSDLELVCDGTRNIYDVAIDPFMNLFTCDNTNDGDGWNVRLSHMIQTANYGYPRLYKNFPDEMMPTMVDYGGGSPTGAIFLDEPNLEHGLFTVQWGWNNVASHPLTRDGATFKAGKEKFVDVPRPTGIDTDGQGNLYVGSWKGAVFDYNGPNAGYLIRLKKADSQAKPFPALAKAAESELLELLKSPSATWRFHVQREIVHRSPNKALSQGLERLALSNESLQVRVAAIFTLKQLLKVDANKVLLKIAGNDSVREHALRALADSKKDASKIPTSVLTAALTDKSPSVRLQAVIELNRLDRAEAADAILPLTAESDPAISHVSFRALAALNASKACFAVIDKGEETLIPGAFRALRNMHTAEAVDGLITRLNRAQGSQKAILTTLCRLYYREADWDGSWWGTRPDTTGPYYKPVVWGQSDKIRQTLQSLITSADEAKLRILLPQIKSHRIDFPGLTPMLISSTMKYPQLRSAVVDLLARPGNVSSETISFLRSVGVDSKEAASVRIKAFEGLEPALDSSEGLTAAFEILSIPGISSEAYDRFISDTRFVKKVDYFKTLAAGQNGMQCEIAYAVLLKIATNNKSPKQAKDAATQAIDSAWASRNSPALLRAIGSSRVDSYAERVQSYLKDADQGVARAAAYAVEQLESKSPSLRKVPRKDTIAKISYEDVLSRVLNSEGDAKMGARLFESVGCIKCHTTSSSEPLKGPFLGDIAARYGKPELIESILRPNAQITQGFVTTTVTTKDESEYDGFIVRESGDELEIRNIGGATIIPKKDITKRGSRSTSIMPEGLMDLQSPEDLSSILAYLQSLKPKS